LIEALRHEPGTGLLPVPGSHVFSDPLSDEDLHLALYVAYELAYGGFDGVDERWEWDPGLIVLRRTLEQTSIGD
jgi:hypothetical protein